MKIDSKYLEQLQVHVDEGGSVSGKPISDLIARIRELEEGLERTMSKIHEDVGKVSYECLLKDVEYFLQQLLKGGE